MDTEAREYIEVAGLMAEPTYAETIRRKAAFLGLRLLVWDVRVALAGLPLPPPMA